MCQHLGSRCPAPRVLTSSPDRLLSELWITGPTSMRCVGSYLSAGRIFERCIRRLSFALWAGHPCGGFASLRPYRVYRSSAASRMWPQRCDGLM